MSHLRLIAALGLGVIVLLFTGAADARPAAKAPSVTSRVSSAQQQLRKLPKSTWAKGRRSAVLRQLAKASRDAKRKPNCAAAAGSTTRATRC